MEITHQDVRPNPPCPRGYVATICIRCFKGRKDVLVHLFRPTWDPSEAEGYAWSSLIREDAAPVTPRGDSRNVVLESFTRDELEQLVRYLSERYADRLVRISTNVLDFPLPPGLLPLSSMPEGKDMGRIRFEIVPGYALPFPMHGLYDLSQHKPMDQGDCED